MGYASFVVLCQIGQQSAGGREVQRLGLIKELFCKFVALVALALQLYPMDAEIEADWMMARFAPGPLFMS